MPLRVLCASAFNGLRVAPVELTNPANSITLSFVENLLEIIHQDDGLLVLNKPAGLVCHPTKTGAYSSLISRVRLYLGNNARPHLINRLDRETSGVMIVATTDEVARELRQLWESRAVEKEYVAIVHGHVQPDSGLIDAPLGKDEHSRVAVKDRVRPDGLPSQTEYSVAHRFEPKKFSLLNVRPRTGHKHQIRIHLAHLGHPIVGDKLYGGDEDLYMALVEDRLTAEQKQRLIFPHHALHAQRVRFAWRGQLTEFSCQPEPWFSGFGSSSS